MGIVDKLFGTHSERELKKIWPIAEKVFALEDKYRAMSEHELRGVTDKLRARLDTGETLDDILPDAYAACVEVSDRVLGMRHFKVQVVGGIVLHQGRIAEMKTGEGKTLVATLPAYLNALTGRGVHVVTVNDYLAKFQSEWMGRVYKFLGMTVGLVVHDVTNQERKEAYEADITYGTNNEFGFDYLRDNMVTAKEDMVQREHAYSIVDEVDSILIDEARTPLIISGQGAKSTDLYMVADRFARSLRCVRVKELDDKDQMEENTDFTEADYIVDEKHKSSTLTTNGVEKAEKAFNIENLTDPENSTLAHHINQAIKAHGIMHLDIDYVVKDNQVIIVDEFTGRLMFGRRYNEGLHQAIEAKEGVKVERESKTLATITFQNYFRLYSKLAGMTGTAMTEEAEFRDIYKLDVIEIPTNQPMIRQDYHDSVYKTENGKFNAAIEQIIECHAKGQPVLVGTVSIEKSEKLAGMLGRRGIPHQVLNAKHHEKEAEIVAQAGKKGAVTIATNMAGRGTDIILGGNAEFMARGDMKKAGHDDEMIAEAMSHSETEDEMIVAAREEYYRYLAKHKEEIKGAAEDVCAAGGLFIIGTERHDSRRIDNQLRGRAGRQGDPGESRFYLSMEDDLLRLFGGDRVGAMMDGMKIEEDMPLEFNILTKTIENCQRKIEERNFGIRKNVLQFDDVMNRQRELIYKQRRQVLDGENLRDTVMGMIEATINKGVSAYTNDSVRENWNMIALRETFAGWLIGPDELNYTIAELEEIEPEYLIRILTEKAHEIYAKKEELFGDNMREIERIVLLRNVDMQWMDHIDAMDDLKQGIHMRAYAQRDPVVEYRLEGFEMFDAMVETIRENTVHHLMTVMPKPAAEMKREQVAQPIAEIHGEAGPKNVVATTVKKADKPGRNDPCPCGSGKKYKKCCGINE